MVVDWGFLATWVAAHGALLAVIVARRILARFGGV